MPARPTSRARRSAPPRPTRQVEASALAFAFPTIDLLYRSFPRKRKVILDPSFRVDADGLHQVGPHRQLAVDDGGVHLGRGGLRLGAFDGKAPTHLISRE